MWALRQSSAKSSSSEEDADSLEEEDLRGLLKIGILPEVADLGNPLTGGCCGLDLACYMSIEDIDSNKQDMKNIAEIK